MIRGRSRALVCILAGSALLAACVVSGPARSDPRPIAIDGDTMRIGATVYRIIGIDTPETHLAKCDSERQAGERAKLRLQELLDQPIGLDVHGTDKYRRRLARVFLRKGDQNIDIAEIMIAENHARRYSGKSRRLGWCG